MRYDATLKKLFLEPPNRLLSLALSKPVAVKRMLPTDLIRVENLHPDLLFEDQDGEIIHAEVHGYQMGEFACRNLIYYGLLLRDYRRPPKQVVFWIGRERMGVSDGLSHPPHLEYSYPVIDVRDIDAALLLQDGGMSEAIFAILCKLQDSRQVVGEILRRISLLAASEQREPIAQLLVLSGLRGLKELVSEEVKNMPLSFDIHENEFLEEVYQEGLEIGVRKGIEQGLEQGLERGRLESAQFLLELLEAKFGLVSTPARTRIAQGSSANIQNWQRRALACHSLDDVFAATPLPR